MTILCKIGLHDWWPISAPHVSGYSESGMHICAKCGKREYITFVFTDQPMDKWRKINGEILKNPDRKWFQFWKPRHINSFKFMTAGYSESARVKAFVPKSVIEFCRMIA